MIILNLFKIMIQNIENEEEIIGGDNIWRFEHLLKMIEKYVENL